MSIADDVIRAVVTGALNPPLTDNVDPERFATGMTPRTPDEATRRLDHLLARAAGWEWLDGVLDPASRRLLRDRLTYHVLGHAHARVGPSRATVDALLAQAHDALIVERDITPIAFAGSRFSQRFDLRPLGLAISVESYVLGIQGTFQLQQYLAPGVTEAHPRPGDVAIDAGACFGETALWLADRVGPDGHVHSLEFEPGNLTILRGNLDANPQLAGRIEVIPRALWDEPGRRPAVDMSGPASTIVGARADPLPPDRQLATTTTLDDLALDRVDFVKLDIEGAEPAALRGARRTLTRDRPRLALAAYHDIDHLHELARAVAALDLDYRFSLGHFTMHDEETVLYAWVDPQPPA